MELEYKQKYQQLLNNLFTQKLEQNKKRIKIWTDYKKRHQKVIEGLQTFPQSVSENCMVPIGKRALMKGKLTHTNEILVCLGDGYFAKYSASQAIALCNRRITCADEMLKSLEAERNLYEMQQILPLEHDVFGDRDRKEILEYWDEDKLEDWRVQHTQRMKEYYKEQTKLREQEKTAVSTDEDLFKRLDELEVQEELRNEIYRLETERKQFYGEDLEEGEVYEESEEEEEDMSDLSDEITIEMLQDELKKLKNIHETRNNESNTQSCATIQNENFDTNCIEREKLNVTAESNQENLKKNYSPELKENVFENVTTKEKKKVLFVEPDITNEQNNIEETLISQEDCYTQNTDNNENFDGDNIIKIEILHSLHTSNIPESSDTEIQSPVDIYKMISTPKSILKRSPNDMLPNQIIAPSDKENINTEDDSSNVESSAYNFVIKDIKETKDVSPVKNVSEKRNEKKIVSSFRRERTRIKK